MIESAKKDVKMAIINRLKILRYKRKRKTKWNF